MHITADVASKADIDAVIFDDEIYDRIGDDAAPPKEAFRIPYDAAHYIGGYVDGAIASLYVVHGEKMHFMVLKPYRKWARRLLASSMTVWPYRVYVEIPALYREVINFARKAGFKEAQIEQDAYRKGGKSYDIHTLIYEG